MAASIPDMTTCILLLCSDQCTFLDMMERYFQQPTEVKLRDARPNLHYQVHGWLVLLSLLVCSDLQTTAQHST
jgi:hypothetical protein